LSVRITNFLNFFYQKMHRKRIVWLFENGCCIGFHERDRDMYQPYVTDGKTSRNIFLLLNKGQVDRAKIMMDNLKVGNMCFDLFFKVASGGFSLILQKSSRDTVAIA
jgi:hypothetical protein